MDARLLFITGRFRAFCRMERTGGYGTIWVSGGGTSLELAVVWSLKWAWNGETTGSKGLESQIFILVRKIDRSEDGKEADHAVCPS